MSKLELLEFEPEGGWIDQNGHMNVAYYVVAFDRAIDVFLRGVGMGPEYGTDRGLSIFTVQNYVNHFAEVMLGEKLKIALQVIDLDAKRLHLFLEMRRIEDDELVATDEQMLLHVDMKRRRASRFPADRLAALETIQADQQGLPRPEFAGRPIQIPRKAAE